MREATLAVRCAITLATTFLPLFESSAVAGKMVSRDEVGRSVAANAVEVARLERPSVPQTYRCDTCFYRGICQTWHIILVHMTGLI